VAEIYPLGKNRLFYKTSSKYLPDEVTADLIDSELNKLTNLLLKSVENVPGLYYFEPFFSKEGTYIVIYYEWRIGDPAPTEKTSQGFSTRRIPAEVEVKIRKGDRGPNVIG